MQQKPFFSFTTQIHGVLLGYLCFLNRTFKFIMSNHNQDQLKAVEHIFGPLRVLAGPGTGKTEVLGQRIAHLINSDSQVEPNEILCITFTDAGRIAMRNRLTKICGPDIAQKVAIHTFHSFCNTIIQDHRAYFNNADVENISELEEVLYLKKTLDALPNDHLLRDAKKPYKAVKMLKSLFHLIKKEGLIPEEQIANIDHYMEFGMPQEEKLFYKRSAKNGAKAGDKKQEYFDLEFRFRKTKAAIRLFDDYQKLLRDNGRYDFDDMILWVIRAFQENQDILFDNAERYQFILVDEYQDTNGSQNKLLELLCDANDDVSPNLFVVGDDDQSIYSFQGANRQNMSHLKEKYGDAMEEVTLVMNYRSVQEILDFSENLIRHNGEERIKTNFDGLVAHKGASQIPPQLKFYQNERMEMVDLALQVEALLAKGVAPKEIAVLFTKNEKCITFGKYLNCIGINYFSRSTEELLTQPLIKKIVNVLQYISLELTQPYSGDLLLFEILHYDFFKIPPHIIALASVRSAEADAQRSLRRYLNDWRATQNPAQFKEAPDPSLINAINLLENLIGIATQESVYILFKDLVRTLGIHGSIIKHQNKIELLDQLTALFEFIEGELTRDESLDLHSFMDLLSILSENDIKIPHIKVFGDRNSVQVSTLHGSKGLEYEYVFIPTLIADNWEKKRNNNNDSYKLVVDETQSLDIDEKLELRRLLYVGMTRAKKELVMSLSQYNSKNKELAPSTFLFEVFPNATDGLEPFEVHVPTAAIEKFAPLDLAVVDTPRIQLIEKEYINSVIDRFSMSATALNNYLRCPLDFYYNNILRVPFGISESTSFGSAIHNALEMLFDDMQKSESKDFAAVEYLTEKFAKEMYARKRNFTTDGYDNLLDYGKRILENFYKHNINTWNKIVKVEWKPKIPPVWNGIPLVGFMDKLEFTGLDVNIVDYKTGNVDSDYAAKKLKEPYTMKTGELSNGGDYWRQAMFYKILMDNDKSHGWSPRSAEFVFVEPSKKTEAFVTKKYSFSKDAEDIVYQQIADTYQKIKNHEFSKGCGDKDCKWCGIVEGTKQHEL